MPTKTERILSYLPGTFRASPQRSALHALVDAFGTELLNAENSLAAIMQAHWVDHADRGADAIDDLAKIASLYGLAPYSQPGSDSEDRPCSLPPICDESVEEFREHLKRYVRTFLEGTITVQGILRIAAETLGLRVVDDYDGMDTWWARSSDALVTTHPRGDDAALRILGRPSFTVHGHSAQPAQVIGSIDLGRQGDLRGASKLLLQFDGDDPLDVDLLKEAADPASVDLRRIVQIINSAAGADVARTDADRLVVTAASTGPESQLHIHEVADDAAPQVLGLASRTFRGNDAQAAQVQGVRDLDGGVDLSHKRYLRLVVDGAKTVEVDCAGPNPEQTMLAEIVDTVNDAMAEKIASHDGHYLVLTSPTVGFGSSIAIQRAAAQDAADRLLGAVAPFHQGQDAQPARVTGARDLSGGVDLTERFNLQLDMGGGGSVGINCAGHDPPATSLQEIITAINAAFESDVAQHDGRSVTVTSPALGAESLIVVGTAPDADAAEAVFGLRPRSFAGSAATAARIVGEVDLSAGVNLFSQYHLSLAVDGGASIEADLRAESSDWSAVSLAELAAAINSAAGAPVAQDNGKNLVLVSPTMGGASSLTVSPLAELRRRRFVTRAPVRDDAAETIFGVVEADASGRPATQAQLVGQRDLSRGVDLRDKSYIRVAIDDHLGADIDCRGDRPRATLVSEVVERINTVLKDNLGLDMSAAKVASHNGVTLTLTSPSLGGESKIALEQPRAEDALDLLLGQNPGLVRGQEATTVRFVSTRDLSDGIELVANAAIKLGIDDAESAQEISLTGEEPGTVTLTQLMLAINQGLGMNVVTHDGRRLSLSSNREGSASRIEFAVPSGADVTVALFGVSAPRTYQGADALPARVAGTADLSAGADLGVARFLKVSINGGDVIDVDCSSSAADVTRVSLGEITDAINAAAQSEIATAEEGYLILTSPTKGFSSRIGLERYASGDARDLLFGDVESEVCGDDAAPASITGTVDLLSPVNLSQRSVLRIAVDGGHPFDLDVAGADPTNTYLGEIIDAINEKVPDMAATTDDDRLQIVSPTKGVNSQLNVLPVRQLELIEYPPVSACPLVVRVRHGDAWSVVNRGACATLAEIEISNEHGVAGPALVNRASGWRIRLFRALRNKETVRLTYEPRLGIRACIEADEEEATDIHHSQIMVGPLGTQAWVPFEEARRLSVDHDGATTLQLHNPLAKHIIRLRAKHGRRPATVSVVESDAFVAQIDAEGDGYAARVTGRMREIDADRFLVDRMEKQIVRLQAGSDVQMDRYDDLVVVVTGSLHDGEPPLLVVTSVTCLFDVTIRSMTDAGGPLEESYSAVTIGENPRKSHALAWQLNIGPTPSQLVSGEVLCKEQVLNVSQGRSRWLFQDCYGDRFNRTMFNHGHFAGGLCLDRAVFDVSHFGTSSHDHVGSVFADAISADEPASGVILHRDEHLPGAFHVNLPLDLPDRFGGRFSQTRFGQSPGQPEIFEKVVTEPAQDANHIVARIDGHSALVSASPVDLVPLGWSATRMPFRRPQFLTLGSEQEHAQIYVTEEGLDGYVRIMAREPGAWGKAIALSARPAGSAYPAMYDICIVYQGTPFENARQTVRGDPPLALTQELLEPSAVGILRAKAAGIKACVTRDSTASVDASK